MTTAAAPSSLAPGAGRMWARSRGILLVLLVLLLAGVALAALHSEERHGRLDPASPDPQGSRALAQLLENRGVGVRTVTTLTAATAAADRNTTLLIATPDLLSPSQQAALRAATAPAGGRTVLVDPGPASLDTLAPGVAPASPVPVTVRAPQCSLPAAHRAGTVDTGGQRYSTQLQGSDSCYPSGGLPTVVRIDDSGDGQGADSDTAGDIVLLGAPDLLYNADLDKQGNASLALQLLGSRSHLVWYLPSLSDSSATGSGDARSGFLHLLPSGWLWGTLQLFVAAGLAAFWRGRRLGPLVSERLPVVIRASEATEGRARLYRRADARDRAARALRSSARERLAPLLGVQHTDAHNADVLTAAVTARLRSTHPDPHAVLFGPAPNDDAGLVHLADQLDALEREVRTS